MIKLDFPSNVKYCANCHTQESLEHLLKTCGKCQAVYYCSKECQTAAWPHHKTACPSLFSMKRTVATTCPTSAASPSKDTAKTVDSLFKLTQTPADTSTPHEIKTPAEEVPNIFKTFESNYAIRKLEICPSMEEFDADAQLIEDLLKNWRLSDKICFFDFLGFIIYKSWKEQGGKPKDLQIFCKNCKRLSVELSYTLFTPTNSNVFMAIRTQFQLLSRNIPDSLRPKFSFLLKILGKPEQTIALGCSNISLLGFPYNTQLSPEDITKFLDFAYQMHSETLTFLSTPQDAAAISKLLTHQINQICDQLQTSETKVRSELTDLSNFIFILKHLIDQGLLQKNIPIQRSLLNIQKPFTSKYRDWINTMLKHYISSDYEINRRRVLQRAAKDQSFFTDPRNSNLYGIDEDEWTQLMHFLSRQCTDKPLSFLEREICKRLDRDRKKIKSAENYANIFSDMVCLYQIIHDLYIFQDLTQDQLCEKHIPDSIAQRAFLPKQKVPVINSTPPTSETAQTPSAAPSETVDEESDPYDSNPETSPTPVTEKTTLAAERLELKKEEKQPTPMPAPLRNESRTRKTFFPEKNATRREVLKELLNNGFAIQAITGSHYQMIHVLSGIKTTVPYHKSIHPKTLSSIRSAFNLSQSQKDS